jgi:hypothetical protein
MKEHTAELVRVGVLYSRDLLGYRQGMSFAVGLANGTIEDASCPGFKA